MNQKNHHHPEPQQKSWRIASLAGLLLLTGCAGSGEGLDENGLPVGNADTQTPERGTLAYLQANIFSPVCSECHTGSNAPFGLRLDSEDNSFTFLVDVSSGERPELMRVNSGNPDLSYIVMKVEGDPSIVGGQMPLNRTPLSAELVNELRVWIADGALRFPPTGPAVAIYIDAGNVIKAEQTSNISAAINPETFNHHIILLDRLKSVDNRSRPELARRKL